MSVCLPTCRKGEYKKVVDEDALRRKREEHAVKLGRAKKEEQRNKRRQALEDEDPSAVAAAAPGFAGAAAAPAPSGRVGGRLPTAEDIPFLITQMKSGDEGAMLEAVTAFRKMLSKEDHPPIDTVSAAREPTTASVGCFGTCRRQQHVALHVKHFSR